MTLDEYAASRDTHPNAVRAEYRAMMRTGEGLALPEPTQVRVQGGVSKFCLPVLGQGGATVETESVIIPMDGHHGNTWHTLCVSSQVGCRMACSFCETGDMGLVANLSADQIVAQRLVARRFAARLPILAPRHDSDGIGNIVFMGMGEPLDNLDAVLQAIRVLNEPAGLNIPLSRITISTVGRIDGLWKLAAAGMKTLRLAISLNAARDDLRNELMPVNKGMPLAALQRVLAEYPLARRGRFLIEYVLMKGVNDSLADADLVAAWCRPLPCVVNLIPYNPQRFARFAPPDDSTLVAFMNRLKERGQFVKRRLTHGQDLMGACGQLGNPGLRSRTHKIHVVSDYSRLC
jgi:23S rRNA (adenine2503-C2)-methyltransferase